MILDSRMKLYHGTTKKRLCSALKSQWLKGWLTTSRGEAIRWAKTRGVETGGKGVVVRVNVPRKLVDLEDSEYSDEDYVPIGTGIDTDYINGYITFTTGSGWKSRKKFSCR